MNGNKRPVSVTLLGIFVLVAGIVSPVSIIPILLSPGYAEGASRILKETGQNPYTTIISGLLLVISGLGILKGFSWGRILLLAFWPFRIAALAFIGTSFFLVPNIVGGTVAYLIFIVILFAPDASAYFRRQRSTTASGEDIED
ncbi:MAG: hypothetical protein ABFD46_01435 [Armatimonadota bacterium]